MSKTTLEYGGIEKAAAAWGICDDLEIFEVGKGKSTVSFRTQEKFDPAAGPQFAFDQPGIVRLERTGSGTVWSGGTITFKGNFDSPTAQSSGGRHYIRYRLHDVWWYFERQQFKQHRNEFAGFTDHDPTKPALYRDIVLPEIYLGEKPDETRQTNGQQITEVLNWVNEVYNPTRRGATGGINPALDIVQAGTIQPAVYNPVSRQGNCFCSEACYSVMRLQPDGIFIIDRTTTPPTLHLKTLAKWNYATSPPTFTDYTNLPEVTVDLTAEEEKEMVRQQQDIRRLNGVIIYYRKMVSVDGKSAPATGVDKYPPGITDFTPETSSHQVDLTPFNMVTLEAAVIARPVADAVSATASDRKDWWLKHDKSLNSPRVDQNSIVVLAPTEFKDENGVAVDLSLFPNELYGTLPNWTERRTIRATARATLKFDHYTDSTRKVADGKYETLEVTYDLVLTNALTQRYTAVSSVSFGEFQPVGVAESVFRSVDALQQQGTLTLKRPTMPTNIRIGVRLKLIGPNHTWTNIFPQEVAMRPHRREITVSFGPSAAIDADKLVELAKATRYILSYNMPSGRATGSVSGSSEMDMGIDGKEGNTLHGVGGAKQIGASYSTSF